MLKIFQISSEYMSVRSLFILSILYTFSLSTTACFSQNNCFSNYIQLDEASGFDLCGKSMVVDDAVRMLMDSLAPVDSLQLDFRDSMGVYGFGFYRLAEKYEGLTVDDILDEVIANEITHKYYVLYACESTEDEIFKKYHVRSFMPDCMVQHYQEQNLLQGKIQFLTEGRYLELGSSVQNWAVAEKEGLDSLSSYVGGKKNCCLTLKTSCGAPCLNSKEILNALLQKGFNAYSSCELTNPNSDITSEEDCVCPTLFSPGDLNPDLKKNFNIFNFANTSVVIDGRTIDLEDDGDVFVDNFSVTGNAAYIITRNETMCDKAVWGDLENKYESSEYAAWIHVWQNPTQEGDNLVMAMNSFKQK